jgi:hypothetical protein
MKNIFIEEKKSHDSVDASGALIPGFVLARRYEVRGTKTRIADLRQHIGQSGDPQHLKPGL